MMMSSYSGLISKYDLSLILIFEITSCEYFDHILPLSKIKHGFKYNHEQLLPLVFSKEKISSYCRRLNMASEQLLLLVFWRDKRSPSCLLFYVLPAAVCPHEMVMGWLHDFLALLRKPMSWSEFVWGIETFSFQNSDLWWTLPFYHSSSISNCGPLWQNKLTFFKVQRNSFIKSFKHLDLGSCNPTTAYHRPRWLCTAA